MIIALILLAVHLIFCIAVYILMRVGVIRNTESLFPMVLLIPVWGAAVLAVHEANQRADIEVGSHDALRLIIEDEIYRNIPVDDLGAKKNVAPINEILLLNNAAVRREVVMDVLYDNPADYIGQLQLAKENDDTEIVHYAVTALTELQKDYDLGFQHIESRMALAPDDEELMKEYFNLLERYINSGLIEHSSRAYYVEIYVRLLAQQLETKEDYKLYIKKFDADMELKNYDEAYHSALRIIELKPGLETGYLKMIQFYAHARDRKGIDSILEQIKQRNVYLSPEARGIIGFWQKKAAANTNPA